MARVKIGNVKPVKGVDYFTPADIKEIGKSFATTESVNTIATSLTETQEAVSEMDGKFAPAYTHGTEELVAGETPLETGKLHFVYE